jgi:hypothetical protein
MSRRIACALCSLVESAHVDDEPPFVLARFGN